METHIIHNTLFPGVGGFSVLGAVVFWGVGIWCEPTWCTKIWRPVFTVAPFQCFDVLRFETLVGLWNWRPATFLYCLFWGEGVQWGLLYVQQLCLKNVNVSNWFPEENAYQQDIQQIWLQLEFDRQNHWLFGWECYSWWPFSDRFKKTTVDIESTWIEMCHGMCQDSWKSVNLRIRNACSSVHTRKWWMLWLSKMGLKWEFYGSKMMGKHCQEPRVEKNTDTYIINMNMRYPRLEKLPNLVFATMLLHAAVVL